MVGSIVQTQWPRDQGGLRATSPTLSRLSFDVVTLELGTGAVAPERGTGPPCV
jgi:hypothetical protein